MTFGLSGHTLNKVSTPKNKVSTYNIPREARVNRQLCNQTEKRSGVEVAMPLIPLTLRVQAVDGSVEEYRIRDGEIQVREFPSSSGAEKAEWRKLRPAELADHVEKKTIVSQWLRQKLGWRGLLRACVADRHGLYGEAASMEGIQAA